MNSFNKDLLIKRLDEACPEGTVQSRTAKYDDEELNLAISMFLSIKEYEKEDELNNAKADLQDIFNYSVKGMTKNQIYNEHCARMTNALTSLLKSKSLVYEPTSYVCEFNLDDFETHSLSEDK